MSIWPDSSSRNDIEPPDPWLDQEAERAAALEDEPEPEEYDPGPEVDDEGGMSEYRHYADWAEVDRAEHERDAEREAEAG